MDDTADHRSRAALRFATGIVLLAAIALAAVLSFGTATRRWQAVPVLSGSMEPAIEAGALAVAVATDRDDVAPGDVIVFRAPNAVGTVTVHRVASVTTTPAGDVEVTTKGDANAVTDPWGGFRIRSTRVWTVAGSVAGLGRVVLWARSGSAQVLALVLLVGAVAYLLSDWRIERYVRRQTGLVGEDAGSVGAGLTALVLIGAATVPAMGPGAQASFVDAASGGVSVSTRALSAPSLVSAETRLVVDACDVVLTWVASTTSGVDGYVFDRRPHAIGTAVSDALGLTTNEPVGPWEEAVLRVEGGDVEQAVDVLPSDGLETASRFRYRARATIGAWESADSNVVEAQALGVCDAPAPGPLAP